MPEIKDFKVAGGIPNPSRKKRMAEMSVGALLTIATLGLYAVRAMKEHREERRQNIIGMICLAIAGAAIIAFLLYRYL